MADNQFVDDFLEEIKKQENISKMSVMNALLKFASSYGADTHLDKANDQVTIEEPRNNGSSNTRMGFYDMKPAFARSANVKFNKAGDWYMIVPIRRKVSTMSTNLYKQARNIAVGGTAKLEQLLNEREVMSSPFGTLPSNLNSDGSQNLGGNLTRIKYRNGSMYVAFRTVSAHSKPNSWIAHYNVHEEDDGKMLDTLGNIIETELR